MSRLTPILYLKLTTSIEANKKKIAINSKLGYSTAYLIWPDNHSCRTPFKYSVRANRQPFHPSLALLYIM